MTVLYLLGPWSWRIVILIFPPSILPLLNFWVLYVVFGRIGWD